MKKSFTESEIKNTDIVNQYTMRMGIELAGYLDDYVKKVTPKWYQWCILRGGVFKWIALKLIKVIIVSKSFN